MNKTKPKIKDIEVDGNTVRFINVRKGEAHEPSIVIESRKPILTDEQMEETKAMKEQILYETEHPEEWGE